MSYPTVATSRSAARLCDRQGCAAMATTHALLDLGRRAPDSVALCGVHFAEAVAAGVARDRFTGATLTTTTPRRRGGGAAETARRGPARVVPSSTTTEPRSPEQRETTAPDGATEDDMDKMTKIVGVLQRHDAEMTSREIAAALGGRASGWSGNTVANTVAACRRRGDRRVEQVTSGKVTAWRLPSTPTDELAAVEPRLSVSIVDAIIEDLTAHPWSTPAQIEARIAARHVSTRLPPLERAGQVTADRRYGAPYRWALAGAHLPVAPVDAGPVEEAPLEEGAELLEEDAELLEEPHSVPAGYPVDDQEPDGVPVDDIGCSGHADDIREAVGRTGASDLEQAPDGTPSGARLGVYVASRLENARRVREVQGQLVAWGHRITYDWTTHGSVQDDGAARIRVVAEMEAEGVTSSDVVVALLPGGRGTHCEIGMAIGAGVPVILVIPPEAEAEVMTKVCAFYLHPLVQIVPHPNQVPPMLLDLPMRRHAPDDLTRFRGALLEALGLDEPAPSYAALVDRVSGLRDAVRVHAADAAAHREEVLRLDRQALALRRLLIQWGIPLQLRAHPGVDDLELVDQIDAAATVDDLCKRFAFECSNAARARQDRDAAVSDRDALAVSVEELDSLRVQLADALAITDELHPSDERLVQVAGELRQAHDALGRQVADLRTRIVGALDPYLVESDDSVVDQVAWLVRRELEGAIRRGQDVVADLVEERDVLAARLRAHQTDAQTDAGICPACDDELDGDGYCGTAGCEGSQGCAGHDDDGPAVEAVDPVAVVHCECGWAGFGGELVGDAGGCPECRTLWGVTEGTRPGLVETPRAPTSWTIDGLEASAARRRAEAEALVHLAYTDERAAAALRLVEQGAAAAAPPARAA